MHGWDDGDVGMKVGICLALGDILGQARLVQKGRDPRELGTEQGGRAAFVNWFWGESRQELVRVQFGLDQPPRVKMEKLMEMEMVEA